MSSHPTFSSLTVLKGFLAVLCFWALSFAPSLSVAQCTNTALYGSYNTNTCGYQTQSLGSGEYIQFYVYRCRTYDFEMTSHPAGTYQMTGRNGATQLFYTSGTGAMSQTWTATYTGYVNVHVNLSNCQGWHTTTSAVMRYRDTGTIGIWRGGVSNNWATATNWDCNAIPTTTTETLIPAPCVNNPTIFTGTNADVRCIKIDGANGAAVTVQDVTQNIRAHGTSLTGQCQ
tara:strand:+ start:982 stop:1668 length:687 start_codon:yes stop_codon:yes gene_type:complete